MAVAQVLVLLIGLIVLSAGATVVVFTMVNHRRRALANSPAVALGAGDGWYRHALRLARLLERLRRDDMVAITIPEDLKGEIDTALKRFWDDTA